MNFAEIHLKPQSYWEKGLGISSDGTDVPKWRAQKDLVARRAALVATELGVRYKPSIKEEVAPAGQAEEVDEPMS